MSYTPCVCPKDHLGRIIQTHPRCFDHAPWDRHPSEYTVILPKPSPPPANRVTYTRWSCTDEGDCLVIR